MKIINGPSSWLMRTALLIVFSASTGSAVWAQTPREHQPNPQPVPTSIVGEGIRHLRTTEITQVTVRKSDSLLNGALIGAGVAVASGLFVCTRMEPWRNCRDDVGPMLRLGAIGAGVGIAIDALIRERRTINQVPPGSASLHAAPVITRQTRGLQVSLSF